MGKPGKGDTPNTGTIRRNTPPDGLRITAAGLSSQCNCTANIYTFCWRPNCMFFHRLSVACFLGELCMTHCHFPWHKSRMSQSVLCPSDSNIWLLRNMLFAFNSQRPFLPVFFSLNWTQKVAFILCLKKKPVRLSCAVSLQQEWLYFTSFH